MKYYGPSFNMSDDLITAETLKEVFDCYEEDTISDEQVRRMLEPVLIMISEGRFDRPRSLSKFAPLTKETSALVLSAVVALMRNSAGAMDVVEIQYPEVLLTDAVITTNMLSGRAMLGNRGMSGVIVTLVNTVDVEIIETAVTAEDGTYEFRSILAGTYVLSVALPPGMVNSAPKDEYEYEDCWISINGKTELTFSEDGEELISVDIVLYLEE